VIWWQTLYKAYVPEPRFSIPSLAPSLQFNSAAAWNTDTSVWILTLFHLFSPDFHSGLSTYVGQNKLTEYVFLVWNNHWKCCIYISYKCQYFTIISFEMTESTVKPLPHIHTPDMLWDYWFLQPEFQYLWVLGSQIMSKDSSCVCSLCKVVGLQFQCYCQSWSKSMQSLGGLRGALLCCSILITFSFKLEFCSTG
jgi:hypothetical protein